MEQQSLLEFDLKWHMIKTSLEVNQHEIVVVIDQ
jgi:hypothetical protein